MIVCFDVNTCLVDEVYRYCKCLEMLQVSDRKEYI